MVSMCSSPVTQKDSSLSLSEEDIEERVLLSTRVAFSSRHLCEEIEGSVLYEEKHHKEKTKTGASALVVCLNIDIDPPDVQKIPPYSKVEAWFDPTDANSLRALEVIGRNLQAQYERWQPRARFKQCLDPTLEDVKNLTISLRRNVKGDRILFHYNGHGVPRPTENGEIWVFNTKFTKYIPLSLYDLQRWLGAPSVYVFDCQNAGRVIRMYEIFCRRRMAENLAAAQRQQQTETSENRGGSTNLGNPVRDGPVPNLDACAGPPQAQPPGSTTPAPNNPHLVTNPPVTMENTIMLAACREDEDLPQNPELPADLFTACLTTPIRMALRWHWLRHQESFPGYLDEALLDRIPGAHSNRMSLLGEINWIFTAVTDTIAWCSFPIDLFQKLFRQDLLVAGLFRNFLLAERIMKTYGCTPVSAPALPTTFRHSMWTAWDHTLDRLVHYLPRILKVMEGNPTTELKLPIILPSSPGNNHQQHHQQIPSGVAQLSQIGMVTTPMPPTMAGAAEQHLVEATVSHRLNQRGAHVTSSGGLPALAHGKRTAEAMQLDDATARQNFYGQAAPTNRVVCDLERKPYTDLVDRLDQLQPRPQVPARPEQQTSDKPVSVVPPGFSTTQQGQTRHGAPLTSSQRPLPRHPAAEGLNQQLASESDGKQRPSQEGRVRHPTRDPSLVDAQSERLVTQKDLATHLEETEEPTEEKQADGTKSKAEADSQQPEMNSHTTGTAANDEDDSDVDVDEDELDDEDEVDDSDDESDESYEVNEEDSMKAVARSCWTAEDKPLPVAKVIESAPPKLGKDQIHTTSDAHPPDKTGKQNAPDPLSKPPLTKEATQVEQPEPLKLDAEQLKQLVNYSNTQIDGRLPSQNTAQAQPVYQTQKKTSTGVTQKTASTALPPAQITDARPPECTLTALRRQQHVLQGLHTLQTPNGNNKTSTQAANNPAIPQVVCPSNPTTLPANFVACATPTPAGHTPNHSVQPQSQQQQLPGAPASNAPVYAGSVIGGSGPASFFTSQMTAFKVWLQTADEKQPPAMQLPILLQILLSQSHRTRAMQLLSEFLDLGPWAVTHCLMVGILPYIARLFSSSLSEVKPHLVFIWGKIIASAQTEFSRSDSVRDGGFKYFMNCLNDTENLSPLTRTITAFALTKMLEKEPFGEPDTYFQDASLKQNFLPMVLSQLSENPPSLERELPIRMRLWLIFGLSKLWRKHDDARWFGIRYNVTEVLFNYLDDVSPEVRAATTYALGTLVDNQTTDPSKKDHADQISQQVITRLIKLATLEASPLVRCELVAALCPLVRQFEIQLCAMAHHYLQELQQLSSTAAGTTLSRPIGRPSRHSVSGFAPSSHFTGRPDDVGTSPRPSAIKDDGLVKARRTEPLALPTFFAGTTNVYAQFWLALVQLSNDPYPKVAQMTRQIMNYLLARVSERFGIPLTDNSPSPCASVTTGDQPERIVPSFSPASASTSPLTNSSMRPVSNPSNQRNSFSNESSPPNTVERASGPASTIKNTSPNTQPHMSHSMCSSPNNVPVNYFTQRRPNRTNVPLTSTFLLHSAQFTGRRHHQVDQLVRKPLLEAQSSHTSAPRVPPIQGNSHLSDYDRILGAVQKTQFFAWSCRWFTQPLLAKYGQTCSRQEDSTRGLLSCSSSSVGLVSPRQRAFSPESSNDRLSRERWMSGAPDPDLAALCAVSVDPDAVAYADRLTRLTKQREDVTSGRRRWLEAIGPVPSSDPSFPNQSFGSVTDGITYCGRLATVVHNRNGPGKPSVLRFHPHQPHLVVADHSGMSVCSSQTLARLNYLPTPSGFDLLSRTSVGANRSDPAGLASRITDVQFLNCSEERGLLLSAHEDGRVRIWRNYLRDLGQDAEVVTAWVGLSELLTSSNPAGMVSHWSQYSQQLTLGGDSKVIRLWDCERESRIRDLPTTADACVTSLARSLDQSLLCAGFGDGGVRVFDLRIPASASPHHSNDCHIFSGQGDSGWIHDVAFGPCGRLYATGSTGGVSAWQLTTSISKSRPRLSERIVSSSAVRKQSSISKIEQGSRFERRPYPPRLSIPKNTPVHCTALKVDLSPLSSHLAVAGIGGSAPQLLVHRIQGGTVHSSLTHIGRERIHAPVCLAVHPFEPLIVAGLKDKSVVLLLVETKRASSRVSQVLGLQG